MRYKLSWLNLLLRAHPTSAAIRWVPRLQAGPSVHHHHIHPTPPPIPACLEEEATEGKPSHEHKQFGQVA